ncbi:hypothetical protein [Vreelandella stevensii]|uniref:hypothetical protein n=1 Tax=Halomonadaceae TaxID=28256 RepID=UPI0002F27F59|nr:MULTISPECIES: hypothetical protein [Halomonas]NGO90600.1 hypothetical protein [Halomonas sp.]
MDTQTLVLVVAIGALWLSVTCGCVAGYMMLVRRASAVPVTAGALGGAPPPVVAPEAPALLNAENAAWEVKVLFEEPSPALNDRLSAVLSSAGAVYEQRTKTFAVAGDSSRTPILIENALGSGQLPPLTESQASHPPVKGVSLRIAKTQRMLAPSKLQLAKLVSLSKKLAKLGGTALDAEKQPITSAGFEAVIQGRARV